MSFPSLKYAVPVFTAVFAAYIGIKIYGLFRVPKGIKNIPAIPLFTTLGYMLKGIPFDVREEHTINAILTEEGLARKWQRGEWVISLADPDFAKQFLTNIDTFPKALGEMDIFRRNKESSFARFLGGDTILFSNGETWKRYRMFSNRAFNPAVDTKYFGYFAIKMFAEIQRNGSLVEFRNLSQRITLDVMGKYMFGTDFQALDDQFSKYAEAYNHIVDSASDPLFIIFPFLEKMTYLFPKCAVVHKALDDMDELFYGIIERKRVEHRDPNYRSREDKSKDILDLMMEAEDSENGTQLSPQELRDNMAIFFIAGHDTTSSSLTNAVYYLAKYKDIQRKVREEIIRVLGDEPKDIIPSLKETKEMSYLTMVLREVLRMNPSAGELPPRIATESFQLGRHNIPAGTLLSIDIHCLMHNPKIWGDDAEAFIPERHEPQRLKQMTNNVWSWLPFSGGPRKCVGMNMAMAEMRTILAMLLKRYEFDLPEGSIHADKIQLRPGDLPLQVPLDMHIRFAKRY